MKNKLKKKLNTSRKVLEYFANNDGAGCQNISCHGTSKSKKKLNSVPCPLATFGVMNEVCVCPNLWEDKVKFAKEQLQALEKIKFLKNLK